MAYAFYNRTHGCFISQFAGTFNKCSKSSFYCDFLNLEVHIFLHQQLYKFWVWFFNIHRYWIWLSLLSEALKCHNPFLWPVSNLDQMLGFKKLKCDVDEQLPKKRFNPKWCNVFNFTPSDGVAPFLGLPRGSRGWGWGHEGMAGEEGVVTEALGRREQGLKSEGEKDNKELNKNNNENGKGCKIWESGRI